VTIRLVCVHRATGGIGKMDVVMLENIGFLTDLVEDKNGGA
jgi:hypothetical protein